MTSTRSTLCRMSATLTVALARAPLPESRVRDVA